MGLRVASFSPLHLSVLGQVTSFSVPQIIHLKRRIILTFTLQVVRTNAIKHIKYMCRAYTRYSINSCDNDNGDNAHDIVIFYTVRLALLITKSLGTIY